jgi:3-hydroxybutyryl-CoA dehydrogenase
VTVPAPATIGVVGAGTMGAGIAQLACLSGARTLLHDPVGAALSSGIERVSGALARGVQRGRLTSDAAAAGLQRLYGAPDVAELADAELVIEAAPERLEIKQELFGHLSREVVGPDCVLATNTSSLLVTAIAAAAERPERVVGMHFFNPAPVMALLEVVAGMQSAPEAVALARAAGEAMGKVVIDAADGPGFLVNRCNRPFGLEALRLLAERTAPVEQIDRLCRRGGGFRMGPFEVMDLVGIDVGFDVAQSFFAQSFGEPRWRPSPLAARMVAAGRLGRKSGRGWYDYSGGAHRPDDPAAPAPERGDGLVVIAGESQLAIELGEAAATAGWAVADPEAAAGEVPRLILDLSGAELPGAPLQGAPQAICCAAGSLAALDPGGSAVGFNLLPPLAETACVELTRGPDTAASGAAAAERFFRSLGKSPEWVGDGPGLALGRIVAGVINECAFALGEGVGDAADIDAGMIHGLNYPRGPLAWGDAIGLDEVLATLEGLYAERREERYRPAPMLQALVLGGRTGRAAGEGFFRYDA